MKGRCGAKVVEREESEERKYFRREVKGVKREVRRGVEREMHDRVRGRVESVDGCEEREVENQGS